MFTHIDFTDGADHDLAWRQLLTALGKQPEPEPPREPTPADWFLAHPYPMPPNFTGRLAERTMLTRWLDNDPAHPHEQTGYLVRGRLRLSIGTEQYEATAGDSWCIAGGVEHAADILEDSVAIEVFSPVREDYMPET